MNTLELYIDTHSPNRARTIEIMDTLQAHGIVSDTAVWPHDVAEVDAVRAVEWLATVRHAASFGGDE